MGLENFSVIDRNDKSKKVDIVRYVIDHKDKPTAVLFGKFSPWTGSNGHNKLLDFAKEKFDEVIIVSPTRSSKDKNIDIFTDEQKEQIINKAVPNIKFYRIKSDIPMRMFTRVVDLGYERPVFIVGKDREKDFSNFFIKYNKNNKSVTDTNDKNFGKGEYLVVSRDDKDTSATKVRNALKNNDKEEFLRLTGYDEDMWILMSNMISKTENFTNFYYKEL